MTIEKLVAEYDVFIFELDDVLYPKKDYLLQVYYLFAQFIEYTEQKSASEILSFMQESYHEYGEWDLFEKTAKHFDLDEKYKYNFELLHESVRLPLKLLLFVPILELMKLAVRESKSIFLLTSGNPAMQLNKIRQMEWNGLETHLIVYFAEELSDKGMSEALQIVADKHSFLMEEAVMVADTKEGDPKLSKTAIKLLAVDKLLSL